MKIKTLYFLLLLATFIHATVKSQQITNTYRFYNNLSTTEPDCADDLIPTLGLNLMCQPSTGATPGSFITDTINSTSFIRSVYHNNLNWGLKYLNTSGVIKKTYTIHLYVKVVNFNKDYTRIIDFSNGAEDNGIYFTNVGLVPASNNRCLNFYPSGNFGICPFFNNSTYYLLTFTRNDATKIINIYVNGQLFTSYNDAASFYISDTGKPIHIFRDDPIGYDCEDGEANFAYLSFGNYFSTQASVMDVYQNINTIANANDFTINPTDNCINNISTINYTGTLYPNATYSWDWGGGTVLSGSNTGPFQVQWASAGVKNITLSISNSCVGSSSSNVKQISILPHIEKRIDTSICPGASFEGYTLAGIYSDTFTSNNQCDSIRIIDLKIKNTPQPDLGADQKICLGDTIILTPGIFPDYTWQDGSKNATYQAINAGTYLVTVNNGCETKSDQVDVTIDPCRFYFPNAFTPNNDGKNDLFKLNTSQLLHEYKLKIFNRYGQLLFTTNNPNMGWNGMQKNSRSSEGVYVWYCTIKRKSSSSIQSFKGTLVLIR